MTQQTRPPSVRQRELLERAYEYALENGLSDLSLRPLAAAIGSSPRVLLYLFESKEGLVRALLDRARTDELELLRRTSQDDGFAAVVRTTWAWLSAESHRPLLALWLQAYARSLTEPTGPWADFAQQQLSRTGSPSSRPHNLAPAAPPRPVGPSGLSPFRCCAAL
ncbi:TetR/AcrR family transcriptional regulator [Fodinicola feengrottensis]|uniref:TetR/AcrR family transcriptional regulator n=1 Tax=Fodinicola feengrottensis TaxID=435914 RepID=UPI002442C6BF|nr:TetR/AcrR family transcriptional regulator [Fodinicola feengrottensis]